MKEKNSLRHQSLPKTEKQTGPRKGQGPHPENLRRFFWERLNPTALLASLLTNLNYRAIARQVLSYFESQRFGNGRE